MSPKGRGSKKTPPNVVELLQEEVSRTSQAATARATGLTLQTVQRYIKGIGEPTTDTLKKLSDSFHVSTAWLRGESQNSLEEERFFFEIAKGVEQGQAILHAVNRHFGRTACEIMQKASKLDPIEQRSLLRELMRLLNQTGRGVYSGDTPHSEIAALLKEFKPRPLKIVIDDKQLGE